MEERTTPTLDEKCKCRTKKLAEWSIQFQPHGPVVQPLQNLYGHIYYIGLCTECLSNFRQRIRRILTEKKVLIVVESHSEY